MITVLKIVADARIFFSQTFVAAVCYERAAALMALSRPYEAAAEAAEQIYLKKGPGQPCSRVLLSAFLHYSLKNTSNSLLWFSRLCHQTFAT